MENNFYTKYSNKGYKFRGSTETPHFAVFIYEYETTHYSLTEFVLILSEFLGHQEFTFRVLVVPDIKKQFVEITFIK